jgi:hypothetical protein
MVGNGTGRSDTTNTGTTSTHGLGWKRRADAGAFGDRKADLTGSVRWEVSSLSRVLNVSTALDALTNSTISTVDITASGNISAASFSGAGSALTALDAENISTGTLGPHEGGTGLATDHEQQTVGRQRHEGDPDTTSHWDNVNTRLDRKRRADGGVGDGERHGVRICHGGGVLAIPGYSNVSTASNT